MSEPLIRLMAELPPVEPDPGRAARTRIRCRARLARQGPRAPASRLRTAQAWQLMMALLGAAYLTEAIVQAVRLYGLS